MSRTRRPFTLLAIGALPVAAAAACYGATSMRVELLTDFACADGPTAAIYTAGDSAARANTTGCSAASSEKGAQSLGDIVFASKKSGGATVTVKARLAIGGADPTTACADASGRPTDKCVFASRTFTYVEHESLDLTMHLYRDCLGKSCGEGETCIQGGQCVPDTVACSGETCGVAGEVGFSAEARDAGEADAPRVAEDAASDASVTPTCLASNGTDAFPEEALLDTPKPVASSNKIYWVTPTRIRSFDMKTRKADDVATLDDTTVTALAAGASTVWSARTETIKGRSSLFAGAKEITTTTTQVEALTILSDPGKDVAFYALGGTIMKVAESEPPILVSAGEQSRAVTALWHDAKSLLVLAGGLSYQPRTETNVPPTQLTSSMTALGSNGEVAAYSQGDQIGWLDYLASGAIWRPLANGDTPEEIALDQKYVYWKSKSNGNVLRKRRGEIPDAPPELVLDATRNAQYIAPDGDPQGCVFYWSGNGKRFTLHATPKPPDL